MSVSSKALTNAMASVSLVSTNGAILTALNDLIDVCQDGAEGYMAAWEHLKDDAMKGVCSQYAKQRGEFVIELQGEMQRMGQTPEPSGTIRAAAHRGWINLKSAITNGDAQAILAECRMGEQIAVETYERVLHQEILPQRLRDLVQHQYDQIRLAHDSVESLASQSQPRA